MKTRAPHEILEKQFRLLKKQNSAYSMRALARDLNVSISFLSDLLKGKRPLPVARLKDFKRVMKMDDITQAFLDEALDGVALKKLPRVRKEIASANPFRSSLAEYGEIAKKHLPLFEHWYNVAIMDLVTTENFVPDMKVIAQRLGIRPVQAQQAFDLLLSEGFIANIDGHWVKTEKRIRLPTTRSTEVVRGLHAQLIQLAQMKLLTDVTQDSFEARLINGVMFAANPANLERAKARLNDALFEVAEILSEGDCTEVYQLNCQMFPLTKS